MHRTNTRNDCEFLFAALAEKHNAVIRKIRELPPWEWGCEFLELEPQVLRFLGTFAKRYPECAAEDISANCLARYAVCAATLAYRLGAFRPAPNFAFGWTVSHLKRGLGRSPIRRSRGQVRSADYEEKGTPHSSERSVPFFK